VLWVPVPHDIRLRRVLSRALSNFLLARAAETQFTFDTCATTYYWRPGDDGEVGMVQRRCTPLISCQEPS